MKVIAWPAYSSQKVNPYTSLLYEHIEKERGIDIYEFKNKLALVKGFDVLHVHWPEAMLIRVENPLLAFLYIFKFFLSVVVLKAKGTKVVWTVHNLKSHEPNFPLLRRFYFHWFFSVVDGLLFLSNTSMEVMLQQHPKFSEKPLKVTPHGHYRGVYPNHISQLEAKQNLSLKETHIVLLFLGQVRPYKNIPGLIETFRETSNSRLKLIIAGEPNSEELRAIIQRSCASDSRIHLFLNFIDDSELQMFFNASDLVILPYQEILNSGTALLSLSFNKPIVVPNKGSMAELKEMVGSDWVYTYEGDFSSSILADCLSWLQNSHRDQYASLQKLDWLNISKDTISLYREVLGKR